MAQKTVLEKGDKVYHFAFGECLVRMVSSISGRVLVEVLSKEVIYYKAKVKLRVKQGETLFVSTEEIFNSKEDVPGMFDLQLISMNVKIVK